MFEILFEENRQKILRLVWDEERTAGEIAGEFRTTFGAVSQHLKLLRDLGFLTVRKEGRQRFYRTDREKLGPLGKTFEALWALQLNSLKTLAEAEEKRKRRN